MNSLKQKQQLRAQGKQYQQQQQQQQQNLLAKKLEEDKERKSKRREKLVKDHCEKKDAVSAPTKFNSSVFNALSNEQKVRVLKVIIDYIYSIAFWIESPKYMLEIFGGISAGEAAEAEPSPTASGESHGGCSASDPRSTVVLHS